MPFVALCLTLLAAASGSVLLQPYLAQLGVPAELLRFAPLVVLALLLVPPGLLSGDWLWVNDRRREGPPRGQVLARLALLTSGLALVVPLALTTRPLGEVAQGVLRLADTSASAASASPTGRVEPATRAVADTPPAPSFGPPVRRWSSGPVARAEEPPQPALPVTVPGERPFGDVLAELPMPVEGTRMTVPQPPEPLLPGTFLVYEWVDRQGDSHWSDDFNEIPNDGKVLRATVMKPPAPADPRPAPPTPQAPPGRFSNPYDDPMLPGPAESYWRGKFSRANDDVRSAEKKIAAKEREIIEAPLNLDRSQLRAQLRGLQEQLAGQQGKVQDLEREASWRAVPREWRH